MENIYNRLRELFDYQGINTPTDLQKKYGFNNTTATNYFKKGRVPKTEFLLLIKQKFENLDLNWLFTGEGEMLIGSNIEPLSNQEKIKLLEDKMVVLEENRSLLRDLNKKEKEIAELKIENLKLKGENIELKKEPEDSSKKVRIA